MDKSQLRSLPSPFYRVATRAIVFDDRQRLLVLEMDNHEYELPGGGWEFNETYQECLQREIEEELHVAVASIGPLWFSYRGESKRWGYQALRLAAPVTLQDHNFRADDDHINARFVTRTEFLALAWCQEELEILTYTEILWPVGGNV